MFKATRSSFVGSDQERLSVAKTMSGTVSPGFDSFADNYEQALSRGLDATGESKEYFACARIHWLNNQLRHLGEHPSRILDFGCGTGASIPLLLSMLGASEAIGVDVSKESLKIATDNYSSLGVVKFATPEATLPAANVDLAFCNGVFHHIPVLDRAGSMKYIFDSLRPGGIFAFWENNPWNPGTRYVMSRIPFDRDAVTLPPPESGKLAKAAGFDVLFTRFLFYFPKSLKWLRWIEPAMDRVPLGGQYVVLCRKPGYSPRGARA
jgi:SAM-dependent methyltransferase